MIKPDYLPMLTIRNSVNSDTKRFELTYSKVMSDKEPLVSGSIVFYDTVGIIGPYVLKRSKFYWITTGKFHDAFIKEMRQTHNSLLIHCEVDEYTDIATFNIVTLEGLKLFTERLKFYNYHHGEILQLLY